MTKIPMVIKIIVIIIIIIIIIIITFHTCLLMCWVNS